MIRVCLPLAILATAGCTTFQTRAPNVTIVPARIAVLPPLALAYELDFYNKATPLDDWATAMAASLHPEVDQWVTANGGHVFAEQGATVPYAYKRFRKWTATALAEIAHHGSGRGSVEEWAFEENLLWLRDLVDADFVLVTLFRDMRQTPGRTLGDLAGSRTTFLQFGAACLVDVKSARMVWCNTRSDAWRDLSVRANARMAVDELLTDLYPAGPGQRPVVDPPVAPPRTSPASAPASVPPAPASRAD